MKLILITLLILITITPLEAKRPRHKRAHTVQKVGTAGVPPASTPEPKLSPCWLGRQASPSLGDGHKISADLEKKIKLGIEAPRPANVDPCPGEPLPSDDFVPIVFLREPLDNIDREAKAFKREDGKFLVLNKGTVNVVWTMEQIADLLKRRDIAVKH